MTARGSIDRAINASDRWIYVNPETSLAQVYLRDDGYRIETLYTSGGVIRRAVLRNPVGIWVQASRRDIGATVLQWVADPEAYVKPPAGGPVAAADRYPGA